MFTSANVFCPINLLGVYIFFLDGSETSVLFSPKKASSSRERSIRRHCYTLLIHSPPRSPPAIMKGAFKLLLLSLASIALLGHVAERDMAHRRRKLSYYESSAASDGKDLPAAPMTMQSAAFTAWKRLAEANANVKKRARPHVRFAARFARKHAFKIVCTVGLVATAHIIGLAPSHLPSALGWICGPLEWAWDVMHLETLFSWIPFIDSSVSTLPSVPNYAKQLDRMSASLPPLVPISDDDDDDDGCDDAPLYAPPSKVQR